MKRPLISNEKELAEVVMNKGFSNGFTFSEALAVAKYYRHILNYGDRRVRTSIIKFCQEHDVNFRPVPNKKEIKSLVARSKNHFYVSETVIIRKAELDAIEKIKIFRFQRILLGLLVIAKLSGKKYVPTYRWRDVKKIISRSVTTYEIKECIRLAFSIKLIGEPSNNDAYHKLLFVDELSEPVFIIKTEKDLLDLPKNYEIYSGGAFRYCVLCGKKFKKTGKKHILCPEHSRERELERKRKWKNNKSRRS